METRTILAYLLLAVMVAGITTLFVTVRRKRKERRRGRRSWW